MANKVLDSETWKPYEDANLNTSPTTVQPAHFALFQEQASKLFELAGDMVNTFYAPRERFTSRRLAASYGQYQAWFRALPEELQLKNTSLPHVLVLHMYYYGCVLHLFRPYIKLDLSGANLFPRDTCTFCANEISALTAALRAMYGLRRVCPGVITILLSASTIHLLNLPSDSAAQNLTQALHDFEAISVNHRFAARSIDIIRALSAKWSVPLPESAGAVYRSALSSNSGGRHEFLASPPHASTFFAASISRNTSGETNHTEDSPFAPPSGNSQSQQQQQHDNTNPPSSAMYFADPATSFDATQAMTAFWTPFPAQGMPIANPTYAMFDMEQQVQQQQAQQQQEMDARQWSNVFASPEGKKVQQGEFGRQQSAPGKMDETMGGTGESTLR